MIRFITLFIGAFLAVMIAIQEIGPYFITDIEFPQNELIITLGVAIGSLLVVVLPRVAMVVFVTVACYSALQVQLGAEDNLYIYASAAAILTIICSPSEDIDNERIPELAEPPKSLDHKGLLSSTPKK